MASKWKEFFVNQIIPLLILFISLLQLYFHYSTITTQRSKILDEKDKRNTMYTYKIYGRQFDLNLNKTKENFEDSPLMNINIFKNCVLNLFQKINEKRGINLDERMYMLFYLLCHDLIYIIIIYIFIYGGYKSGIIKLISQLLRVYFNSRRMRILNPNLCLFQVAKNYFKNMSDRNMNIFNPEGFENFEYLCNYVIVLDIMWLYVLIRRKFFKKKDFVEKEIITDEQKVEYIKKDNSNEAQKEGMKENSNIENNNGQNICESNNDNNIQSGNISLDEGYEEEEESEHISEEEINEKKTK